jgi:hypothetical protein
MTHRKLIRLTRSAARLGFEAHQVVAMRLAMLALGGAAAEREARQMISEKAGAFLDANLAAAAAVLTGRPERASSAALAVYSRRVSANRRRLSRSEG